MTSRRTAVAAACTVAALILGALVAPNAGAAGKAERGIAAALEDMRSAFKRGDAKAVAAYYTEDADMAGSVPLHGRAAIERFTAAGIRAGISDFKTEDQEIFPGDDYSAETGRLVFYDRAGSRVAAYRYMTLWKKEGDDWRIHRDVSIPVEFDLLSFAHGVAAHGLVSVKEVAPIHAVVLPMTGSHAQLGEAIGRLAVWLRSAGVKSLGGPFGRFHNSPDEVGEASLRWEVGFPVPAGTHAAVPYEVREIPGGAVAYVVSGGPHEMAATQWAQFLDWVEERGYQVDGPATEIWLDGPKTEMRVAIRN